MTSECLFVKYMDKIVNDDINFEGKHIGYNTLLRKCTCDKCMKEKASLKRFESNPKNPYFIKKNKVVN